MKKYVINERLPLWRLSSRVELQVLRHQQMSALSYFEMCGHSEAPKGHLNQ